MRVVKKTNTPIYESAVWTIEGDTPEDPVSLETSPEGVKYGTLHSKENQYRVNDGDVIVRAPDGSMQVFNPRDFAEQFEPYDVADVVNSLPKSKAKSGDK